MKHTRDISTAELKGCEVRFRTVINPKESNHNIRHIKQEVLIFDSRNDAENYFTLETMDLNKY